MVEQRRFNGADLRSRHCLGKKIDFASEHEVGFKLLAKFCKLGFRSVSCRSKVRSLEGMVQMARLRKIELPSDAVICVFLFRRRWVHFRAWVS